MEARNAKELIEAIEKDPVAVGAIPEVVLAMKLLEEIDGELIKQGEGLSDLQRLTVLGALAVQYSEIKDAIEGRQSPAQDPKTTVDPVGDAKKGKSYEYETPDERLARLRAQDPDAPPRQ